jgi:uncharacterized protein YodC (DUF2158 family)
MTDFSALPHIAERDATIEQLRAKIDDLKKAEQFSTGRIERLTAEVEALAAAMTARRENVMRQMVEATEGMKLGEILAIGPIYPVGTVVKLRSGGPNMTVISHRPRNGSCVEGWASCEWWERGEKREDLLPEAALKPAHDRAQFRAEVNPAKANAIYNARFAREADAEYVDMARAAEQNAAQAIDAVVRSTLPRDPSAMKPKSHTAEAFAQMVGCLWVVRRR